MQSSCRLLVLAFAAFLLCGCEEVFPTAPTPDYTIRLMPTAGGRGLVAVPPECPDWRTTNNGSLENAPWPQFGCANTRNLAAMVERPEDLIEGRDFGLANAETTASTMGRYITNNTKSLVDPNAQAPTAQTTAGSSNSGMGVLGGAVGH